MERRDLGRGAWHVFEREWVPEDTATQLLESLPSTLPWEEREIVARGVPVLQPRLIAWAGELPYRYSGQTLEPRAWDPALADLRDRLVVECGEPFNHVVLNLYRDGKDHVRFHADDEPELGREPVIASVSLGATRRFVLSPKRRRNFKRTVRLHHRSLYVMGGTLQHAWYHSVPRESHAVEPRINLTFRHLKGPPGWRS